MGTILDSTKELSKKLGVEAEEQTIKDQIDAINKSIDENFGGSVDIAEAVRTYSENAGGGGNEGFNKMFVNYPPGTGKGITFINNKNSLVDVSAVSTNNIYVLNPVDELKVDELKNIGDGYDIYFVPTQNCKIYEGDSEINPNDIFEPVQTPEGPTTYDPDGVTVCHMVGDKSPSTTTKKLTQGSSHVQIVVE